MFPRRGHVQQQGFGGCDSIVLPGRSRHPGIHLFCQSKWWVVLVSGCGSEWVLGEVLGLGLELDLLQIDPVVLGEFGSWP